MRILGSLDQPGLKITVFQMDNRISLKIENELYEQGFKFQTGGNIDGLESIKKLLDAPFLEKVRANFQAMHQARLAAAERAFPPVADDFFDEII